MDTGEFYRLLDKFQEDLVTGQCDGTMFIEYENSNGEVRKIPIMNITQSATYGINYIEADCFSEYLADSGNFDFMNCVSSHRTFKISRIISAKY